MGHNIFYNEKTGKHSFFAVQKPAWHGLGQIVEDYPTSAEAIRFAGLDYEVQKRPLFTYDTDNFSGKSDIQIPELKVPEQFATVRSDTDGVLGVVGKDYQIVQNAEAFEFFDAIVGGGDGILYETAGVLGRGERVFITAKLPGYIRVGNSDDVTEKYIFLSTSHDGSGSITAAFTPIRIVCQNTLNAAMRTMSNVVRIRHTASAQENLKNAHKVMGLANKLSDELEQIFTHWSKVKITDPEVKRLIQLAMCPNKETLKFLQTGKDQHLSTAFKNTVESVYAYAMMSDTQLMETTKGTVFGAYNAVTGYYQNVRKFKTGEDKLKSIIFGGTAQGKAQRAFDLCADFAKDGSAVLMQN